MVPTVFAMVKLFIVAIYLTGWWVDFGWPAGAGSAPPIPPLMLSGLRAVIVGQKRVSHGPALKWASFERAASYPTTLTSCTAASQCLFVYLLIRRSIVDKWSPVAFGGRNNIGYRCHSALQAYNKFHLALLSITWASDFFICIGGFSAEFLFETREKQGWWELRSTQEAHPTLGYWYWPREQHGDGDLQQCMFFHSKGEKTWGYQESSERDGLLSPDLQIEVFISQQVAGLDEHGKVMLNSLCCTGDQTKWSPLPFKCMKLEGLKGI